MMSKGSFILKCGVLGWGIPCGLLFPLVMTSIGSGESGYLTWLMISLPLFMAGGYPFGLVLWRRMQAQRSKGTASVAD